MSMTMVAHLDLSFTIMNMNINIINWINYIHIVILIIIMILKLIFYI